LIDSGNVWFLTRILAFCNQWVCFNNLSVITNKFGLFEDLKPIPVALCR